MRTAQRNDQILQRLEKAVHSGNITAVVPEDLEIEAHNTLWEETDPTELTLLKLIPDIPAKQIAHEFTKITSYGFNRNSGFFGERSLPPETNFASTRVVNTIKLMGEIGPTFLLAALEKTQQALGTTGAQNIERAAIRKNVLWKKNRNLYFSNDNDSRSTLRFQGIAQQIMEGTDGTSGTSPYGAHGIDMQGEPLTIEAIRERAGRIITLFGRTSCVVMEPMARVDLEASMDAAHRLDMPQPMRPMMIGQSIGGVQTQGGVTYFETDNTLSPIYSRPQYSATLIDGAPSGTCTVTATAQADNATTDTVTSRWLAADAGNVFYVVTEVVEERESLGKSTGTVGWTAVAATQEVDLLITPSSPEVESFKVYRGDENDGADRTDPTTAWFIFEVASTTPGAAIHAFDNNVYRPNTSWAFGLNIQSRASNMLHGALTNGYAAAYDHVRANSAQFLESNDIPARNTVAVASLGPKMGILALASILAEVDRPLLYSACTPEVRNPFQNFYFYNVGRR